MSCTELLPTMSIPKGAYEVAMYLLSLEIVQRIPYGMTMLLKHHYHPMGHAHPYRQEPYPLTVQTLLRRTIEIIKVLSSIKPHRLTEIPLPKCQKSCHSIETLKQKLKGCRSQLSQDGKEEKGGGGGANNHASGRVFFFFFLSYHVSRKNKIKYQLHRQ